MGKYTYTMPPMRRTPDMAAVPVAPAQTAVVTQTGSTTGYPWDRGEILSADDLNAAIALSQGLSQDAPADGNIYGRGGTPTQSWQRVLPVAGGTVTGALHVQGSLAITATGATIERAQQDRAAQVIDIRDLGASCDGVTDDTAAWTAAFAKPNGTVIRIPQNVVTIVGDGNFRALSSRAISIVGDGRNSIVRLKSGTALANSLFTWSGGSTTNVRCENFTIDFNSNAQPAALQVILNFIQITGCLVRNVAVINGRANLYMISFTSCTNFVADKCYTHLIAGSSAAQSKGIVSLTSLGPCYNGRITDNVLVNTNTNFVGGNQMYIAGNDISGWGVGAGIATDPNAANNVIIGNKCHDSLTANDMFGIAPNGIEQWSSRAVIANNLCWNCAGAGISNGGNNCLIIGNQCWDNDAGAGLADAGIIVANDNAGHNSDNATIIGNACWDSGVNRQGYGFRVNNSGITNITLHANKFRGVTGDVFLSNATYLANTDYTPRILAGDPTTALGAATKQYVDGRGAGTKLLYQTTNSVGNGADTTQDVLQTFNVPANQLLNVGDRLIIRAAGTFAASTDSKTAAIRWGGANVVTLNVTTVSNQQWRLDGEIIKTGPNAQMACFGGLTNFNITQANSVATSRTDTAANAVDVTGQNATTATAGSITCRYLTVDYMAAA